MNWEVSLYKSNGELRKQFSSWAIPKELRERLEIVDGINVLIKVQTKSFSEVRTYKVTSGGEIRLPKIISSKIEQEAQFNKTITFTIADIGAINDSFENQVKVAFSDTTEKRQKRLEKSNAFPKSKIITIKVFERSPDVVAEVLLRSKGKCEICEQNAPFLRKKNNTPFLEVHHIIRLADGGEDTVANAIAICPNCHRKAHYG